MGALCIAIAAGAVMHVLPDTSVSLRWEHSVEHVPWEERYEAAPNGLRLVEARVHASGAGMDAPASARWNGEYWSYDPLLPPLDEVALANSGYVAGYRVCGARAGCFPLSRLVPRGTPVKLTSRRCPE